MSLDARIESIARQVIAEAGATVTDSGLAAAVSKLTAKVTELGFQLEATRVRVDDLHRELHAVATRITALEQQSMAGATPRAGRPRKATGE